MHSIHTLSTRVLCRLEKENSYLIKLVRLDTKQLLAMLADLEKLRSKLKVRVDNLMDPLA